MHTDSYTESCPPAGEVRDQARYMFEHTSSNGHGASSYGGGREFEFRLDCILRLASMLGDMATPVVARTDGATCCHWHRGQPHGRRGHVPVAAGTADKQ